MKHGTLYIVILMGQFMSVLCLYYINSRCICLPLVFCTFKNRTSQVSFFYRKRKKMPRRLQQIPEDLSNISGNPDNKYGRGRGSSLIIWFKNKKICKNGGGGLGISLFLKFLRDLSSPLPFLYHRVLSVSS